MGGKFYLEDGRGVGKESEKREERKRERKKRRETEKRDRQTEICLPLKRSGGIKKQE